MFTYHLLGWYAGAHTHVAHGLRLVHDGCARSGDSDQSHAAAGQLHLPREVACREDGWEVLDYTCFRYLKMGW